MSLKLFVSFIVLFISVINLNGQEDKKSELQNTYTSYFGLERESIYLHTNKNLFIPEEPVWFEAYIYNKETNQPAVNSTNIFVSLYDDNGTEIDNKLFFAQNGVVSGTLDLNANVEPGTYYLRAYTNWMNNFDEDESFVSLPIKVINPSQVNSDSISSDSKNHDLQFLAESGHAINNSENTIGIKVLQHNGLGAKIKGSIYDNTDLKVKDFETNALGFGKVNINYETDKSYYAIYTINESEYRLELPKGQNEGFAMSIDNYTNPNITYINLKTNQLTLDNNIGKTFYLVINQNAKVSVVELPIAALKTQNTIPVESKNLVTGVNTISIFDSFLNPIAERLIFNYNNLNIANINASAIKASDSIAIDLKVNSKQNNIARLSVSVLSDEHITNVVKSDIISSFLIEPYINGQIQNSKHYFTNINRLKRYDLDLLLLTQGWSKYEWASIKKGQIVSTHDFDVGLNLEGTFNRKPKKNGSNQAQMFSMTNKINEYTTIDESTYKFKFNNYFLKDGAVINFSLYENEKIIPKVKPIVKTLNGKRRFKHSFPKLKRQAIKSSNLEDITTAFQDYDIEKLDTVNLAYKKKKVIDKPLKHEKSYIANKYSNGIKIDSMTERTYFNIADLINANGFVVEDLAGTGFTRIKNRNPVSFLASNEPTLIIDNVNLGNNYDILFNMTFEDIDEIYINTSGMGYGATAGAGVIRVYRKDGSRALEKMKVKEYGDVVIENGYSVEKSFYVPTYYFKSSELLNSYTNLHWKSNITTNNLGNYNYKIKDLGVNEIVLAIQGFTDSGALISKIIPITLN